MKKSKMMERKKNKTLRKILLNMALIVMIICVILIILSLISINDYYIVLSGIIGLIIVKNQTFNKDDLHNNNYVWNFKKEN